MKNKIITCLFITYLILFSILGILFKDKEISNTERRKLSIFPDIKLTSEYITKVDKYFLDHFPFRDEFRNIKAIYNLKFLNTFDNNGVFIKDNYVFKSIYPTNRKSISKFLDYINEMSSLFPNSNIYTMIIPDKNYYLDDSNFLNIDYDYLYNKVSNNNFIDIRDVLELSDYYETDTHWKQEEILDVVKRMSTIMNFNYYDISYNKNSYNKFYGVYYSEGAAFRKGPEKLTYLTSDIFNNVSVKYLENSTFTGIYNEDKLAGMDSYDVYLDGASSFIEITNNNGLDKELIVFRDSFGSSLIPLIIPYYSKIIVIDNRYISSKYFYDLINSNNPDVLFSYSTLIMNDSGSLKN